MELEEAPPQTKSLVSRLAQLLKACGSTPATPFDSWISSYSDAVFHLDEKTPEAYGEEVSEQTTSSCITDSQNSAKISTRYSHAGEES
ncbi:hypothetical protein Bca4012_091598 [Brassica carinata]